MAECEELLDEKEKRPALRRSESRRPLTRGGKGCHEKRMRYGPESPAEAPAKRPRIGLSSDEKPTPKLLNRIAGHVIYGHLQSIANELELPEGRASQAMADTAGAKPKTQIFKILSIWDNSALALTVGVLIEKVDDWVKRGFVDKQVWQDIQELVDFEIPAVTTPTCEKPAQQTSSDTHRFCRPRSQQIQDWVKESFKQRPFSLVDVVDWTVPPDRSVPLMKVYTPLTLLRKDRTAERVDIADIFSREQLDRNGPVRILFQGKNAIGKTTTLKYIALSWANETMEELKRFDFVFYISMPHVSSHQTVEQCIIEQHTGLKANKVSPEEIRLLLDDKGKVLVLIDDHDCRFNSNIDEAIQKKDLWNSWMIVTSRCLRHIFGKCMDEEIEIRGLEEYYDYLDIYSKSGIGNYEVWERAREVGIDMTWPHDLFEVPTYLNMLCAILFKEVSPIRTKCAAMQAFINRVIDREAIRETGETATDEKKQSFQSLGKLAWTGLSDLDGPRTFFTKEEVLREAGEVALKLGLLVAEERNKIDNIEEMGVYCFLDTMIQQFLAANYLLILKTKEKDTLEEFFGSMVDGWKHKEVLRFMCRLMKNPEVLVELACERLLLHYGPRKSEDRFDDSLLECFRFLENLCKDIPEHGGKSHTKRFSYNCRYGTFEFNLSELHDGFFGMFDTSVNSREKRSDELAECAIFTDDISSFCQGELDRTLGQVGRETKVVISSLLVASNNDANEKYAVDSAFTESILFSRNLQVIFMKNCNWPHCVQDDISQKLLGCSEVKVVVLKGIREFSKALWVGLIRNKPLRVLQIEQCTLDGFSLEVLLIELSTCKTLDVLSFAGTEGIRFPWRSVAPLSSLKVLNLDNCGLYAAQTRGILACVQKTDLKMISLSGNKLTDGFPFLANHISNLQKLESICITNAQLSGRDIQQLGNFLSVEGNLRYLLLSQNTLTDQVGCLLGNESTKRRLGLKFLWVSKTQLGKTDLKNLERAVINGRLPDLVSLDLSGNELCMMEEELESLITACTVYYTKTKIRVFIQCHLRSRLELKCQGTMVALCDGYPKFALEN